MVSDIYNYIVYTWHGRFMNKGDLHALGIKTSEEQEGVMPQAATFKLTFYYSLLRNTTVEIAFDVSLSI